MSQSMWHIVSSSPDIIHIANTNLNINKLPIIVSIVVANALELKHQTISNHNTEYLLNQTDLHHKYHLIVIYIDWWVGERKM